MQAFNRFQHVSISVSDINRSLDFYQGLLGLQVLGHAQSEDGLTAHFLDVGNGHTLQLLSFKDAAKPGQWIPDDLQTGLRHIGFKVRDVDRMSARLNQANVHFTLDPLDATGGVRIAFFKDPDGTLLEILQNEIQYHVEGPAKGSLPALTPKGDTLLFDHIAITVSDLDKALAFYEVRLGFPIIGKLIFNDKRGFMITYLKAETAVLELFSFSVPTQLNRWNPDNTALGLKHFGFNVGNVDTEVKELKAVGVPILRETADSFGHTKTALFEGPDGLALELVEGAYSYIQT
jgi:catechol 2,3-dioxygenase-like lactoylglutathione lyase family enzyme